MLVTLKQDGSMCAYKLPQKPDDPAVRCFLEGVGQNIDSLTMGTNGKLCLKGYNNKSEIVEKHCYNDNGNGQYAQITDDGHLQVMGTIGTW